MRTGCEAVCCEPVGAPARGLGWGCWRRAGWVASAAALQGCQRPGCPETTRAGANDPETLAQRPLARRLPQPWRRRVRVSPSTATLTVQVPWAARGAVEPAEAAGARAARAPMRKCLRAAAPGVG